MDPAIWFAGAAAFAATVSAIGTLTLAFINKKNVDLAKASVEQNRRMVEEMYQSRLAQDMPHVVVEDEYTTDGVVELVIRNMGTGVARSITFNFSQPIESSSGNRVSEVGYFKDGLDFLAPGAEVRCFWDMDFELMDLIWTKGLHNGVKVTSEYDSNHGHRYSTLRLIDPLRFRGQVEIRRYGMHDLAKAVVEMSKKVNKAMSMGELKVATKEERRQQVQKQRKASRGEEKD